MAIPEPAPDLAERETLGLHRRDLFGVQMAKKWLLTLRSRANLVDGASVWPHFRPPTGAVVI